MARSTIHVPPRWNIVPVEGVAPVDGLTLRFAPGPGFGDGTHPTTRLCLQAIAALGPRGRAWRLLDFGSGSGVLSVAGALLGATVDAVEIDPRAIEHATRNGQANGCADRIRHVSTLAETTGPFNLVVANILRYVLLSFADALAGLRGPSGVLVLSGLVSTDVPEVSARYMPLLGGTRPEVYERDDWRALVWRRSGG